MDPFHYNQTKSDDYSFTRVMEVTRNEDACVEWCMSVGLLESSMLCSKCSNQMTVYVHSKRWRCCRRSQHEDGKDVQRSILSNSFFQDARIPLCKLVRLMYAWCCRHPHKVAEDMADTTSPTVSDWYSFCRDVSSTALLTCAGKVLVMLLICMQF